MWQQVCTDNRQYERNHTSCSSVPSEIGGGLKNFLEEPYSIVEMVEQDVDYHVNILEEELSPPDTQFHFSEIEKSLGPNDNFSGIKSTSLDENLYDIPASLGAVITSGISYTAADRIQLSDTSIDTVVIEQPENANPKYNCIPCNGGGCLNRLDFGVKSLNSMYVTGVSTQAVVGLLNEVIEEGI